MATKYLRQAFRWYGNNDPVTLSDIRQIGATDIVTALHHIPNGEIWPLDEIKTCQEKIKDAGLEWSVVESLPVTEDIKMQSGNWEKHLENYRQSIANLGEAGIKIVTYNFMPVLDWTRTDLEYRLPEGYTTLFFNRVDLAVFDLHILKRKGAEKDYDQTEQNEALDRFRSMSDEQKKRLSDNIIKGLPGSEEGYSIEDFRKKLNQYRDIDHSVLRHNLSYFLSFIAPIAEEYGIKMVIHPDDPPFDIFGLPRVMSTKEDMAWLIRSNPSPSIGFCFCTGSFGVRPDNDLVDMASTFAERVHFLHFRSTQRDNKGNFYEANHLDGDANIPEVIKVFIKENQKRDQGIPFRPDHGYRMLDDLHKIVNPGYSAIGRMKGLAELRGLERGLIINGQY